jgi:hypothetical protein
MQHTKYLFSNQIGPDWWWYGSRVCVYATRRKPLPKGDLCFDRVFLGGVAEVLDLWWSFFGIILEQTDRRGLHRYGKRSNDTTGTHPAAPQ